MFQLDRNTIKNDFGNVTFKYPIVKTIEINNLVIILLGVHPRITDYENVFAINKKCEIIW